MTALLLLFSLIVPDAFGLTLTLQSTETPHPGVTLLHYRSSNPSTDVWVARIDLCQSGLHIDATHTPSGLQSASAWGSSVGAQLAVNGDFYRSGPVRVYGQAIGGGIEWPAVQTGEHSNYSDDWYYLDYGWIAFGHGRVDYTHSKWVKNHADQFGGNLGGIGPNTVGARPPQGTLALVSGFPELVVEGQVVRCSSPTASSCFPDRTDMRTRHPRTAMGITEDQSELILVAVDGRTSGNSGMYGVELADTMNRLGAYVAFNLDGGGSTQMWVAGDGTVNNASGNNGGGLRGVANHWGVFSGASGWPARAGHCEADPPCLWIEAGGGAIDNASSCFRRFGPNQWWRSESAGQGGQLWWTNAFQSSEPSNWAWWRLHPREAGRYEVEVSVDPTWGVYDEVRYLVHASGVPYDVIVDQGASTGWVSLGTYDFRRANNQFVAVYDNYSGPVPSGQHIVVDRVRLTRVGPWCGDGTCNGDETVASCPVECEPEPDTDVDTEPWSDTDADTEPWSDTDADTEPWADTDVEVDSEEDTEVLRDTGEGDADTNPGGTDTLGAARCACASGASTGAWPALLLTLLGWRRRKTQ